MIRLVSLLVGVALALPAREGLTAPQMLILEDSGGWQYVTIQDVDNGFKTTHACFAPENKGKCHGRLVFGKDGTFLQSVTVHGKSVDRHGKFSLSGNQILFFDEFGYKDGPYTLNLKPDNQSLVLETNQAGVTIRMELELSRGVKRSPSGQSAQKPVKSS